jgi:exopolyphosphatase / guanosine-5'-triphosphate,3'-diphosphate pyrophosphatase
MSTTLRTTSGRVRAVAVIDVGATSIRMAIAEIQPDGSVRRLESLSQAVRLGQDTFTTGEIARSTVEECVSVLRSYRRKLDEYGIDRPEDIRVVATSAVREAVNRITFVDRIFVGTGLAVEPLDEAEIHRITYRGVQPLLKAQPALFKALSVVTEVGGGNTELLLLEKGNVAYSHAFRLGSLRLQQSVSSYQVPRNKIRQVMATEITSQLEPVTELVSAHRTVNMVAMGGDIRFAVAQILKRNVSDDRLDELPLSRLRTFVDQVFSMTEEALVSRFHLTFPDAETLAPALLANLKLGELLGVDRILVSNVNLRDGLVRDLSEGGAWSEDFRKQIVRAAAELGRRYDVDEDHARNVADLSCQLFRQLQQEHELDDRYETLLHVAALLHETGGYVNLSSIHKHSMYLIMHSNLFGLTSDDLLLVALVVRYHRRALPKITHQPYSSMDRVRRVTVSKLAAILRIALALDASRSQRIRQIECTRMRNRLIITVPYVDDLSVEQIALRRNRQFFETIFGMEVQLRAQVQQLRSEPSSQL